jgi:hypothetical protein
MRRKSSIASVSGRHLSLAVAAHLVRTQLVQEPLKESDVEQTLDFVAQALAHTAALHVTDEQTGETRPLGRAELEGAVARRGALLLVLKDGRSLSTVTVARAELRQAIAGLKASGLPELAPAPAPTPAPAAPVDGAAAALLARFGELEEALRPPLLPAQLARARTAAIRIARHARKGRIANLAMQLLSALEEPADAGQNPGGLRIALARLRTALEEAEAGETPG